MRGAVSNFFFSGISGDGICSNEATKILGKREAHFVKSFSLPHCRWWTKGRHEQLRFVRKQIGEPLCPIDSIDHGSIRFNRGVSSFWKKNERERERKRGEEGFVRGTKCCCHGGLEGAGEASIRSVH